MLGPKHPNTAQSYNNLASNLDNQGRYKEAEPLFRKALAIYEEVLGPKHPDTALSYNNLASNLDNQGRYKEAEPLCRKALAVREEVLGPKHPATAESYHNLALNLEAQGRAKEAEPLLRKALAVLEEVLGPKHPDTATSYSNLAYNLQAQGRAKEAEPLWQAGAIGIEVSRLRLAASSLDRAAAVRVHPHPGLAACRARLERPLDAWTAAEAGLARGILDDLAALEAEGQDRERDARRDALDRLLLPLLTSEKLDDAGRRRRDDFLKERGELDEQAARAAADRSRQAVRSLEEIQARLAPDAALVFWVDLYRTEDHWACVVRHRGTPAWVSLPRSGAANTWTSDDDKLPRRLRDALSHGESDFDTHARRLAAQRLQPLAPHLAATADLPAVRHLVVVPVGRMAGVPVEVLTDRYLVSYAPSGSVFARLRAKHRPLAQPTLLALGDPNFTLPDAGSPPPPPDHGLYLSLVLSSGNAARAGLRAGDVLLSYGGVRLASLKDLQVAEKGDAVPISFWRDGKVQNDFRLAPGKLGVLVSDDPPAIALRKRRERDLLADARSREGLRPLPGTRLEVAAIAALLPESKCKLLLGSRASEAELDALAAGGKLKDYRLLHLATHGSIDAVSAARSALELARDGLPGIEEQARLAAAGKRVPTGRLWVETMYREWEMDADLVVLSACQTALGPDGGGEGFLGFATVLLGGMPRSNPSEKSKKPEGGKARSVVLSLWKVDDTATALLMMRFYQNLLGKRAGLKAALPKAEALREAKDWLRTLRRAEVEALAGRLARGTVRATEEPKTPVASGEAAKPVVPAEETPFAHPRFWAAFILLGDPE